MMDVNPKKKSQRPNMQKHIVTLEFKNNKMKQNISDSFYMSKEIICLLYNKYKNIQLNSDWMKHI